jgi:hypothetical protein
LIAGCAILSLFAIETGQNPFLDEPIVGFIAAPTFGCVSSVGALGLSLAVAAVLGLSYGVYEKRNLLPGAVQIASYLIGYLTVWALFGAFTGVAVSSMAKTEQFRAVASAIGIYDELAAMLVWLLPNAAWGTWYVILSSRGMAGMRYANR